jgi:hypothetical protein
MNRSQNVTAKSEERNKGLVHQAFGTLSNGRIRNEAFLAGRYGLLVVMQRLESQLRLRLGLLYSSRVPCAVPLFSLGLLRK